MVKLVFVDMDDTFVAPDKTIPADNLRFLDVTHERGVQFVPCMGRSLRGSRSSSSRTRACATPSAAAVRLSLT